MYFVIPDNIYKNAIYKNDKNNTITVLLISFEKTFTLSVKKCNCDWQSSYQEPCVISVSVLCFQILTIANHTNIFFDQKMDMTYTVCVVNWIQIVLGNDLLENLFAFLHWFLIIIDTL